MTAPGADGVVPDPLGRGGRPPGARAELIMKMIFIKVRACWEAAPCAAVSMPKMRRLPADSILSSGKRRTVQWRVGETQTPRQLAYAMLTSGGLG